MQHIITEMLFPRRCPICDDIAVPWGNLCCSACHKKLRYIGQCYCMKCGKGLSRQEAEYCSDCKKYPHAFNRGRSLYQYESVAASIFRFKYKGRQEYAEFFAEEMYKHLGRDILSMKADAMIPVPLHRSRYIQRGYNQAELLAKALSKRCGIPFCKDIVIRNKKTLPQKQLSYSERQNNLKKAFKMHGNDVKLNTVIIIDDIYTTGSTADELSKVLLSAGIKKCYILTLAAGVE